MDRRHFAAAGTIAAFASARRAQAQDEHAGHAGGHAASPDSARYPDLAQASAHCVMTGQNCLRHCLETFAAGDTTLATCARSVRELIAATAALQDLAAADSTYVPALSRVVEAICIGCEKECRKHAAHHATCKACADACLVCADACRKTAV